MNDEGAFIVPYNMYRLIGRRVTQIQRDVTGHTLATDQRHECEHEEAYAQFNLDD